MPNIKPESTNPGTLAARKSRAKKKAQEELTSLVHYIESHEQPTLDEFCYLSKQSLEEVLVPENKPLLDNLVAKLAHSLNNSLLAGKVPAKTYELLLEKHEKRIAGVAIFEREKTSLRKIELQNEQKELQNAREHGVLIHKILAENEFFNFWDTLCENILNLPTNIKSPFIKIITDSITVGREENEIADKLIDLLIKQIEATIKQTKSQRKKAIEKLNKIRGTKEQAAMNLGLMEVSSKYNRGTKNA